MTDSLRQVFLVDACRTPLGRVDGALASVRPDDLAAGVLRCLVERTPALQPAEVGEVVWGAANQSGEDNRNVARMAALIAGLPDTVPGFTVNRLCASGMAAVVAGAQAIATGAIDVALVGGGESMSRAPFVKTSDDRGFTDSALVDTRLGWRMVNPKMERSYPVISLGETAEVVADRYQVTRLRQDEFALQSHQRADEAWRTGRFDSEVVTVPTARGAGGMDEGIRPTTSMAALTALAPAFRAGGSVTAGNSSQLSDGAAGLLLASEATVKRWDVEPMARYVASAAAGVHPDVMGIGPVPATERALALAGWSVADLDLIELNEAFAAQALAVVDELGLSAEQVNAQGGAIALGHPLGCSGARLVGTLAHQMKRAGAQRGLATLCVGVGQGQSVLLERR